MMAAGLVGRRLSMEAGPTRARLPRIVDVVDLIKGHLEVDWQSDTIDGFKAGDPSREVTGIVTTAMATLPVLHQAAELDANLVITAGPTFYSRVDSPTPTGFGGPSIDAAAPAPDPIFAAKAAFIREQGLVVFRLSEHWRLRSPDPFVEGLAEVVGTTEDGLLPPTTLAALASGLKRALGARGGIRVVGDEQMRVERVAFLPATSSIAGALEALPDVDVLIAGEVREWESVEYARDLVHSGRRKGLILLGRVLSEDPGMRLQGRWLETVLDEIPVRHLRAGDPYWRPSS